MNSPCVYLISHLESGKVYIGSTLDFDRRYSEHHRMLLRNDHENKHLQRSWNKYGEKSFSFEVLFYCDKENLLMFEQRTIDHYKNKIGWRMMYNENPCASSRLGSKASPETRKKMSMNNALPFLGKKHSPETINLLSEVAKNLWKTGVLKGHKKSEETRKKIADKQKGRKVSDETRRKISIAGKGRKVSDETRKKLANSPRFSGRKHSEETKRRISEKLRARKLNKDESEKSEWSE